MKRTVDLILLLLLAPIATPLIGTIALILWLTQSRPIFYRETRAGRHGKPFTLLKFRTMRPGTAPDLQRITPLGKLLRKSSLDELPELYNILKGEMSFVGPRPLPIRYLPRYLPHELHRHDLPPGLTGWAQINGRNALTWEEKFALDLDYIRRQSLLFDLKILLLTPLTILSARGINTATNQPMPELPEHRPNSTPK